MNITSLKFLCFLGITLMVYYIFPAKMRWYILLIASFTFFCLAGTPQILPYLLVSIIVSYIGAIIIEKTAGKTRKNMLVITLVLELAMLIGTKYLNFGIKIVNKITDILSFQPIDFMTLLIPLGISFYTLTIIGYIVDVYWDIAKAERNIFKHAMFCGYFLQLVSGPITRYNEFSKQLFEVHKFNYKNLTFGLQRLIWGLFLKLVISERLAIIVNTVYGDHNTYYGFYIVFATICFAFQLYSDFSGCMHIVLGASEMFGIMLPENFNTPFFSQSITEYWRRWHITLGAWLKDYLFYPLLRSKSLQNMRKKLSKKSKKAGKTVPSYVAMFILWFLIGLWHGPDFKYIIGVGLLHWLYILAEEILEPLAIKTNTALKINTECFSWKLFRQLRTFFLVCIGFVFFRASSFTEACYMIKSSFANFNPNFLFISDKFNQLGLDLKNRNVLMVSLITLLIVSVLSKSGSVREKIAKQNILFRWIIYLSLVFGVIIFGLYGSEYDAASFIYQNI